MAARIRLLDHSVLTELDDGTGVVLHLRAKVYVTLNRTATLLVRRMRDDGGISDAALVSALVERFDVTAEQAAADVVTVLEQLRAEDLIQVEAAAG